MLPLPILLSAIENEQDQEKFTKIFETYYSAMKAVAFSIIKDHSLAEDAVSEAFIKIIRNLHNITDIFCHRTRRYIVVIVENTAKDFWKKRQGRREDSDEMLENMPDGDVSILERLTSDEGVKVIAKAIRSLPKIYSEILILSIGYGHTNSEIAEILGITTVNAKKRLSRAKAAVRQILEGEQNGK